MSDAPAPDLPGHVATWRAFEGRSTWETVRDRGGDEGVIQRALDELPAVSALEALAANRAAVELLVGRRWYVMRDAREAGATWDQIGEALGITKQGAQDYYARKIAEQEKYVGDLHHAARARAAS